MEKRSLHANKLMISHQVLPKENHSNPIMIQSQLGLTGTMHDKTSFEIQLGWILGQANTYHGSRQ